MFPDQTEKNKDFKKQKKHMWKHTTDCSLVSETGFVSSLVFFNIFPSFPNFNWRKLPHSIHQALLSTFITYYH